MRAESNPIIQKLAKYLSDTLQMELLSTGRVASEALFNSIESVVESTVSCITISAQALFYAKFVNTGRDKDKKGIPIDVLVEWMRRRKIVLYGRSAESDAYVMQASIKRKGIKPAPFITKSIKKFEKSKTIENNIERFMSQFLDEQLQSIFNKPT